jgi:hypothetical protein
MDEELVKIYTHVHAYASQGAMTRLAEAIRRKLETREQKGGDGSQSSSAHQKEIDHG